MGPRIGAECRLLLLLLEIRVLLLGIRCLLLLAHDLVTGRFWPKYYTDTSSAIVNFELAIT